MQKYKKNKQKTKKQQQQQKKNKKKKQKNGISYQSPGGPSNLSPGAKECSIQKPYSSKYFYEFTSC